MSQLQADPLAAAIPDIASHQRARSFFGPQRRFAVSALAGSLLTLGASVSLVGPNGPALGLALGGYLLASWLVLGLMCRGYPHDRLGLCNLVTLIRMALAAALLAPLVAVSAPWLLFAVAVVAFALDGVDGWLARREGRVSVFGSRFDMEVDSALALILALNAWAAGMAGALVLLIGLPRYAFAAAGSVLPWLDRPLPERFSRKLVCVLQIGTLIALQLPPMMPSIANPIILGVAATLIWSFGRDLLWLRRTRT